MTDSPDPGQVTVLLKAWADGDTSAGDRLFPIVYEELHRLSEIQLRRSGVAITIQATEVLHEAFLRLADQNATDWKNRAHFFALASTLIRRVLLDHARRRLALRRDRRLEVPLDDHTPVSDMTIERAGELIELHEALSALAEVDPRRARLVELRYFGGLSVEETAAVMDLSKATVKRDWRLARAWLKRRIEGGVDGVDDGDEADPPPES